MIRSAAARRYRRHASWAAVAYVVSILISVGAPRLLAIPSPMITASAVISALPLVVLIMLLGYYLRTETDEYVRNRAIFAILLALGVVLTLSSVLGILQFAGLVGDVPAFLAFVAWSCAWGVSSLWLEWRDRR